MDTFEIFLKHKTERAKISEIVRRAIARINLNAESSMGDEEYAHFAARADYAIRFLRDGAITRDEQRAQAADIEELLGEKLGDARTGTGTDCA
jgi:hypothetical protein